MPNEIHRKLLVAITDLDFDASFAAIDSLADGGLAWSAPVTNCENCDIVEIYAQIKTGTSPTDGNAIELFVGRADDGSGEIRLGGSEVTTTDHGTNTTAATVDRVVNGLDMIVARAVDGTSDKTYDIYGRFPFPGADFNIFLKNSTGAALNGTASPHLVRYRGWGSEIQ